MSKRGAPSITQTLLSKYSRILTDQTYVYYCLHISLEKMLHAIKTCQDKRPSENQTVYISNKNYMSHYSEC